MAWLSAKRSEIEKGISVAFANIEQRDSEKIMAKTSRRSYVAAVICA